MRGVGSVCLTIEIMLTLVSTAAYLMTSSSLHHLGPPNGMPLARFPDLKPS